MFPNCVELCLISSVLLGAECTKDTSKRRKMSSLVYSVQENKKLLSGQMTELFCVFSYPSPPCPTWGTVVWTTGIPRMKGILPNQKIQKKYWVKTRSLKDTVHHLIIVCKDHDRPSRGRPCPVSPSPSLSERCIYRILYAEKTKPYAGNVHPHRSPCYGVPTSTLYILYVVTCNFLSFCLCHVNSVQFSHVIQHAFWIQFNVIT